MGLLVDTNLVCHALHTLEAKITPESAASMRILRSDPDIYLSSISWLELHRYTRPMQRAALSKLRRKGWKVLDVNREIAERGAELLNLRAQDRMVCPTCLSERRATGCKTCKRLVSRPQHFADALIVATAELSNEVSTLYSFDGGVLEMGRLVSCPIRRPPLPSAAELRDSTPIHP